jgi:hydrogenase maturation factor HypF (carbamoyltransferase family)
MDVRVEIIVKGMVQGVGFRWFVRGRLYSVVWAVTSGICQMQRFIVKLRARKACLTNLSMN